jgi:hypothetical protein
LKWSQWSGLNRRPTVYETVALPLSYIGFGVEEQSNDCQPEQLFCAEARRWQAYSHCQQLPQFSHSIKLALDQ